jgi:hypothetical protein
MRKIKTVIAAMLLSGALMGSLSLMILDPLTLLTRSLASSVWPALDRLVLALETGLYRVPTLAPWVARIDTILRPGLFATDPLPGQIAVGMGFLFAAVLGLNWIAERFWCRYLCPLGGMLGWLSRVAIVRRQVTEACNDCSACAHVCPTATIRAGSAMRSDPAECTMPRMPLCAPAPRH